MLSLEIIRFDCFGGAKVEYATAVLEILIICIYEKTTPVVFSYKIPRFYYIVCSVLARGVLYISTVVRLIYI